MIISQLVGNSCIMRSRNTLSSTLTLRKPPLRKLNFSTWHFFQQCEIAHWHPCKVLPEREPLDFCINVTFHCMLCLSHWQIDWTKHHILFETNTEINGRAGSLFFFKRLNLWNVSGSIQYVNKVSFYKALWVQLFLILILQMLSCLQGNLVKELCYVQYSVLI